METIGLGKSGLVAGRLAYGCWRIAGRGTPEDRSAGRLAVRTAVEAGYTLFDLADIYGHYQCEAVFAEVLRESPRLREGMLIATKCGIRFAEDPGPEAPFRYDFSRDYILRSCDASLKRLGVETIDVYQLHRPDYLMNPEEVAGAFEALKKAGKVRAFGVSNFKPSQVALLRQACAMPLAVNQVEISLVQRGCLEDGTLDQCLQEAITPMAWSPLAGGKLGDGGKDLLPWQEAYETRGVTRELDVVAKRRGTGRTVVALAWLLKHPAGIVPIVGSTSPKRIHQAVEALACTLTREEWYSLLEAARGERLP